MRKVFKKELKSPSVFKKSFSELIEFFQKEVNDRVNLSFDEMGDLLLSAIRMND